MNPWIRRLRRTAAKPTEMVIRAASRPLGGGGGMMRSPAALLKLRGGRDPLREAVAGRVVMITGASSGIGEAAARRIGAAGATVLLVARSRSDLERVAAEIEGDVHILPCDLTDLEAIDELAAGVVERHGGVDVLVNNAGRSIRRSVELSFDRFHDFERTMQLNYFASVRLILRLLPAMRERGGGQVINISSAGVQARTPRFSGYIASKAALEAFSDALQAEMHGDGIRFTTISMPLVRTAMIAPTEHYGRFPALTPEQAGDLVADAIVGRPRRVAPPFAHLASAVDALSPELMDAVRHRGYRMFPEE